MSASIEDHNQSINYDEIEEFVSNEEKIHTASQITRKLMDENLRSTSSSSCVTQVQTISLSLEKSSTNTEENSSNQSNTNEKRSVLNVKTSNIPGPVGLLPILVRLHFFKNEGY